MEAIFGNTTNTRRNRTILVAGRRCLAEERAQAQVS
jgi:hypothetical protein